MDNQFKFPKRYSPNNSERYSKSNFIDIDRFDYLPSESSNYEIEDDLGNTNHFYQQKNNVNQRKKQDNTTISRFDHEVSKIGLQSNNNNH